MPPYNGPNADNPERKKFPDGPMAVVATKLGHYGRMREEGEKFLLRNGRTDFSFAWMRRVTGREADVVKEVAQEEEAASQESVL